MTLLSLFQVVGLLVGLLTFYNFYWKRRKLPPGPVPLPVVGNMHSLIRSGKPEETFIKWKKQYGDIYTYWEAELPIVAVSDYDKIIDMFQKDGETYAGRVYSLPLYILRGGTNGVVWTDNELWRDQRRFALYVLRDFGRGKGVMQERVLSEVSSMVAKMRKDIDNGVEDHNVPAHLDICVGSVINALLFGYRWDEDKAEEFFKIKGTVAEIIRIAGSMEWALVTSFPGFFLRLPYFKQFAVKMSGLAQDLYTFYQRQIDEHDKHIDWEDDSPPLDYTEAFLREKHKRDKTCEAHYYTHMQLRGMCLDLFIAGQETSSTALAWTFAYILLDPEVQDRLHEELDVVISCDRLVTMDDRSSLHYTNAVLMEAQRLCNLLPQNILHRTTRDVIVDGYLLPKGATIVPQISAVLYDGNIFPNPKRFDPSRFLDESGRFKPMPQVIPFSVGKRQCLGEGLARMELYLFVANLFHQFKFQSGSKPPSLKRTLGGTVPCQPFTCRVYKRHS